MRDIERTISHALSSVAESYVPTDLGAAERMFIRRRRRRRFTWFGGATLATAAAIVAVAVFPRPDLAKEQRDLVAGTVTTSIAVGEAPVSIVSTRTGVWVANSGDGTVTRIDPATKEVVATIEVGGSPEELATDQFSARLAVWVFDSEGRRIVEVQPTTDTAGFHYTGEWPEGTHLDMAVKDETVWMGDPATETVYLDHRGGGDQMNPTIKRGQLREGGGDVAVGDGAGEAWAYNGEMGSLTLLQGANGTFEPAREADVTDVLTSDSGDLAVGGDALWVSDDFGVIMRIDRKTYEKEYLDLGGRYSDLSYGGGYLWALTASQADDGTATLRQIDPVTARVVGQEFALEGEPVDVVADEDAVWVAHQDADTVTRIDVSVPDASPEPVPSESSNQIENGLGSNDPVVVFSRGGDIWTSHKDGSLQQLTDTPGAEISPVFTQNILDPKAKAIVFERGLPGNEDELVFMDLKTREEETLMRGAWATFWPAGVGAWLERDGTEPLLSIGPLFSEPIDEVPVVGTSDPYSVGPLAWDQNNELLFYAVNEVNGPELYRADVATDNGSPVKLFEPELVVVDNLDADSELVAPTLSFSLGLDVIRLYGPSPSPQDGSFAGAELGTLEMLDTGTRYEPLVDLSELPLELASGRMTLAQAGELAATVEEDGTVRWRRGDIPSWLVGDHDRLFLVDAAGGIKELPFEVGVGASVSFEYIPWDEAP